MKLQLLALGYVEIKSLTTTKNTLGVFWTLTPLGKEVMLQMRTVKAPPAAGCIDRSQPSLTAGQPFFHSPWPKIDVIGKERLNAVNFDIGPHIMGGDRVTRAEWLHIAGPPVDVIGILMALISYGFAAQKPWSRHLVIMIFILIIIYSSILGALNLIHRAIMWRAIINATVFGRASAWYFYFRPNVAAYFRELSDR
jgi:hypothetical protein